MSGGLNHRFKQSPRRFLEQEGIRMLVFEAFQQQYAQHPNYYFDRGIHPFDLKRQFHHVELIPSPLRVSPAFAEGSTATRWSNLIRAYWLPWAPGLTTDLQLGAGARYFFTSKMDGCRLQISGSRAAPHVHHIAGDLSRRDRDIASLAIEANLAPSRRFSANFFGQNQTVNVVGFRRSGRWRFFTQRLDFGGDNLVDVEEMHW